MRISPGYRATREVDVVHRLVGVVEQLHADRGRPQAGVEIRSDHRVAERLRRRQLIGGRHDVGRRRRAPAGRERRQLGVREARRSRRQRLVATQTAVEVQPADRRRPLARVEVVLTPRERDVGVLVGDVDRLVRLPAEHPLAQAPDLAELHAVARLDRLGVDPFDERAERLELAHTPIVEARVRERRRLHPLDIGRNGVLRVERREHRHLGRPAPEEVALLEQRVLRVDEVALRHRRAQRDVLEARRLADPRRPRHQGHHVVLVPVDIEALEVPRVARQQVVRAGAVVDGRVGRAERPPDRHRHAVRVAGHVLDEHEPAAHRADVALARLHQRHPILEAIDDRRVADIQAAHAADRLRPRVHRVAAGEPEPQLRPRATRDVLERHEMIERHRAAARRRGWIEVERQVFDREHHHLVARQAHPVGVRVVEHAVAVEVELRAVQRRERLRQPPRAGRLVRQAHLRVDRHHIRPLVEVGVERRQPVAERAARRQAAARRRHRQLARPGGQREGEAAPPHRRGRRLVHRVDVEVRELLHDRREAQIAATVPAIADLRRVARLVPHPVIDLLASVLAVVGELRVQPAQRLVEVAELVHVGRVDRHAVAARCVRMLRVEGRPRIRVREHLHRVVAPRRRIARHTRVARAEPQRRPGRVARQARLLGLAPEEPGPAVVQPQLDRLPRGRVGIEPERRAARSPQRRAAVRRDVDRQVRRHRRDHRGHRRVRHRPPPPARRRVGERAADVVAVGIERLRVARRVRQVGQEELREVPRQREHLLVVEEARLAGCGRARRHRAELLAQLAQHRPVATLVNVGPPRRAPIGVRPHRARRIPSRVGQRRVGAQHRRHRADRSAHVEHRRARQRRRARARRHLHRLEGLERPDILEDRVLVVERRRQRQRRQVRRVHDRITLELDRVLFDDHRHLRERRAQRHELELARRARADGHRVVLVAVDVEPLEEPRAARRHVGLAGRRLHRRARRAQGPPHDDHRGRVRRINVHRVGKPRPRRHGAERAAARRDQRERPAVAGQERAAAPERPRLHEPRRQPAAVPHVQDHAVVVDRPHIQEVIEELDLAADRDHHGLGVQHHHLVAVQRPAVGVERVELAIAVEVQPHVAEQPGQRALVRDAEHVGPAVEVGVQAREPVADRGAASHGLARRHAHREHEARVARRAAHRPRGRPVKVVGHGRRRRERIVVRQHVAQLGHDRRVPLVDGRWHRVDRRIRLAVVVGVGQAAVGVEVLVEVLRLVPVPQPHLFRRVAAAGPDVRRGADLVDARQARPLRAQRRIAEPLGDPGRVPRHHVHLRRLGGERIERRRGIGVRRVLGRPPGQRIHGRVRPGRRRPVGMRRAAGWVDDRVAMDADGAVVLAGLRAQRPGGRGPAAAEPGQEASDDRDEAGGDERTAGRVGAGCRVAAGWLEHAELLLAWGAVGAGAGSDG